MSDRRPRSFLTRWQQAASSKESGLSSTERHVALAMSLYMNAQGGSCFPGSSTLRDDTGLHLVTIKKATTNLVELGWLQVVSTGGSNRGGKRLATEYRAAIPSTGSSGQPVAEDYRSSSASGPVVESAATGSSGLPQHERNLSMNIRGTSPAGESPAEFAASHGDVRFRETFVERAEQRFEDPHEQEAAIRAWDGLYPERSEPLGAKA